MIKKLYESFMTMFYLVNLSSHDLRNKKIYNLQNKEIKHLMKSAYSIPFYRRKFDECGLLPIDFKCADDLSKFPKLTKDELKQWMESELKNDPEIVNKMHASLTSGSTGNPLRTFLTSKEQAKVNANWIRMCRVNGYKFISDTTLALKDPGIVKSRQGKDSFIQKLGIGKRVCISFTDSGEQIVTALNEIKPDFAYMHRSKLFQAMIYAEANNQDVYQPRMIGIIGESMDAAAEKLIEKYFPNSCFASYGTMETGALGVSGYNDFYNYLLTNDTHVVTILDENDNNADKGRMLITNLFIRKFPIINYEINDGAEWLERDSVRYLSNISGRLNDQLRFSDGTLTSWQEFYTVMEKQIEIMQFRVIQKKIDYLQIQLVLDFNYQGSNSDQIETRIVSELQKYIPIDVKYTFEWLEELEPDKNGKRRYIISELDE